MKHKGGWCRAQLFGGIHDEDLRVFIGYDLAITGTEHVGFTLI